MPLALERMAPTRAALITQAQFTVMQVGFHTAAMLLGIKHWTLRKWAKRYNWPDIAPAAKGLDLSQRAVLSNVVQSHSKAMDAISEQTRLNLAIAALKAGSHAATLDGAELLKMPTAIALDKHAAIGDRAHGWTAQRQQGAVNVAVQVNMPSEAERRALDERHAKLDAITAKLLGKATPGGGGEASE